jgi:hypothetical protein
MKREIRAMSLAALGLAVLTALIPATARADSYWELEHARANARAGGPVSERDAELLERYGCLSGTNSAFCKQLSKRGKVKYRAARKRTRD